MKITVDIEENLIYKWGTIVLSNIKPDPSEPLEVAIPGFKHKKNEENPAFKIARVFNDERDGNTDKNEE